MSAATRDGYGDSTERTIPGNPARGSSNSRLFALVIGVSKFEDPGVPSLSYADADAQAIASALIAQKGHMYSDVVVKLLTGKQARRAEIEEALAELTREPGTGDVSLLYLSGHGMKYEDPETGREVSSGDYYYIPFDADYTHGKIASTGLGYEEIQKYIAHVAGKKLIFLDTCYAAQFSSDPAGLVNLLGRSEGGATVWASSTGNEVSIELDSLKHGVFTAAILDALHGRADQYYYTDRRITTSALSLWLDRDVPALSANHQTPSKIDVGVAFPIAMITPP
jgi:uncharacterized caspase-like protein